MHFHFTEEDHPTRVRGAEIRAALVHARHVVTRGESGVACPADTDVWFHGIGVDGNSPGQTVPDQPPLDPKVVRALLESRAQVVLFQLCDAESMSFYRIPEALATRARLFLRNHWPSDENRIPATFRGRTGCLPPMLKAMTPSAGKPLSERRGGTIFYGTRTGFSNLAGDKNAREEVVRLMRASGLPFAGGVTSHQEARYAPAADVLVPRMKERHHLRLLKDAKICLAPWGNHPLSYRLFEGLAVRCLVIAQSIRSASFLDGGLEPGRHYVEVAPDLKDLVEVVRHYLAHPAEAQRIADAGHELFKDRLASRGTLVSRYLFDATVASWGELYRPSEDHGVGVMMRSVAARVSPNRF